ncbi:MAG: YHYH protein [Bacteroidota bacterium]
MPKQSRFFPAILFSLSIISLASWSFYDSFIPVQEDCADVKKLTGLEDRGPCSEQAPFAARVQIQEKEGQRIIHSNSIPKHKIGKFGRISGSLNPNALRPQDKVYHLPLHPQKSSSITPLLDPKRGPQYMFGIMRNGVLIDPEAAEPWPHRGIFHLGKVNWEWNLDAMQINLGLDCNNAHVQPNGKYHYHGAPSLYLASLKTSKDKMTLLGYAADGFPIYDNYGYAQADDPSSEVIALRSSYHLKEGERPGNGIQAPCGKYSGLYTNDFEYRLGSGDLDECNGRFGVTPEHPEGTYYYIITRDQFPYIPRCLVGRPSRDFNIGRP